MSPLHDIAPDSVSPPQIFIDPFDSPSSSTGHSPTISTQPKRRKSHFKELGIDCFPTPPTSPSRPYRHVRFRSMSDVYEAPDFDAPKHADEDGSPRSGRTTPNYTVSLKNCVEGSPRRSQLPRFFTLGFLVLMVLALAHNSPIIGDAGDTWFGVRGGPIRVHTRQLLEEKRRLAARQDQSNNDPTNYCTRWSHQAAIVNGTMYVYGGQSKQSAQQTANTWNNQFLTLDMTNTWSIGSPSLKGLEQPDGPPPVANGYLWNSYTSLFLYGGEYSDKSPLTPPEAYHMWEYQISPKKWVKHESPRTLPGKASDGGNNPVQNSAEGAGLSVPMLGKGWYFGGHLDDHTTEGWSNQIPRIYLKSMIEYTYPGYPNDAIDSLSGNQPAPIDGAWRNITQGGLQDTAGFTERADGVLVYVPGFGKQGIILGLAGGTNETFTEMNVIDVYDVADSRWYKQSTQGKSPPIRVNPCAVAASAADGSSTNIYLYGGQNLIPAGSQTQYDDMWILTVPSFTWIKVDQQGSPPPARAGHSCSVWDAQMVVVGGYVGKDVSCDSPGIYVFDASQLKWQTQFTALQGGNDMNQQLAQTNNINGIGGSYGYEVPDVVQAVIGGGKTGGATITAPAVRPTAGPLATGGPIVYTVTADGTVVTQTAAPGSGGVTGSTGPNVAAIAAGVVAGVLFVIACYLGFCAYVYRRQLQLYKNHVTMAQRAAVAPQANEKSAFLATRSSEDPMSSGRRSTDVNSGPSGRSGRSGIGAASQKNEVPPMPQGRVSTANSSTDDLLLGQEPSFMGVLLSPRRSLRVINRD